MATNIRTGALAGIDGLSVTAEVDISRGLPGFHLVGLPGAEVRESRERVLAALRHSGLRLPVGKITVNLAPAGVRKQGASFDLAIAMGIVAATEPIDRHRSPGGRSQALFLGELSLFGELRPVRGLLAIVLAAAGRGETRVVVPASQAWEAALVDGVAVVGVATLTEAIGWWRTGRVPPASGPRSGPASVPPPPEDCMDTLLGGLRGQSQVRKAAVLTATGLPGSTTSPQPRASARWATSPPADRSMGVTDHRASMARVLNESSASGLGRWRKAMTAALLRTRWRSS